MKAAVRYYTRSGNIKKLAEAIAKAVGVEAKTVDEPLREDVDILFLGSSVYAYGVDDSIKNFIARDLLVLCIRENRMKRIARRLLHLQKESYCDRLCSIKGI